MIYRLKRFFRNIHNLIRWFPIIWRDEQWDYYYIFELLKHKLIFTAEHHYKYGCHTSASYDANRMMVCVRLIEKIQNESYILELIDDDNLTREKLDLAFSKQIKARKLLFKILEQNIEQWWD
jgi:hypothetical protein